MFRVRVNEVFEKGEYSRLGLFVTNLQHAGVRSFSAQFKFVAGPKSKEIEFRRRRGWSEIFGVWPGREEDQFGSKFVLRHNNAVDTGLASLSLEDIGRLSAIVCKLPEIVAEAFQQSRGKSDLFPKFNETAEQLRKTWVPVLESTQRQRASEKMENNGGLSEALVVTEAFIDIPVDAPSEPGLAAAKGAIRQTNGKAANTKIPKPALELPLPGFRFTARNKSTLTNTQTEQNGETIKIRASEVEGWARVLLQAVSLEEIVQRNLLFSLQVSAIGKAAKFKSVGIGFYKDKIFHLAYTSARNVPIAVGKNLLSIQPPRSIVRRLVKEIDGKSPVFVFLEFSEPVEIEIDRFRFAEAKPSSIPYLEADGDIHDRLRELNANLFLEGKRDLLSWLTAEAEVALRLECFETASRLATILLSRIDGTDPKLKKRILSICVETAFGQGILDDLRTTLLSHIEIVRHDDYLFTALSLCWPAYTDDTERQDTVNAFSRLPSGNHNRAFLAANDLFTRAHGILGGLKGEEPEAYLMAANFFRTKDAAAYRIMMNKYLDHFGLTRLSHVAPHNGNVLASLSFPAPEKQITGPKISVIMATHNAAETVGYAMRSILDQTYSNLELLVCDDSSADGSMAEVEKFSADPRVRIFQSEKNQGPYNIRNALIADASGEFVTFADSDDFSHPQRLERQVQVLLASDASACFGRWLRVTPDGRIAFFRNHHCLRMSVVSFMARKSLFERFGGYRSSLCGADSEFLEYVRLALGRTEVVELEWPLIFGLWSTQSLTRQAGLEATEDGFRSSKRRAYAEIAARRRLLGPELVPESVVTGRLAEVGLFRNPTGVLPHAMGM